MTDEKDFITEENNPSQWAALTKTWLAEKKPGQVITRAGTFMAIPHEDTVKFKLIPGGGSDAYGSTSFGG